MVMKFPRIWQRLQAELRDACELVLVPGLAAVLPWRWCFPVFQRLAHVRWLYQDACETALRQARALGWAGVDESHWLWERRLVTLIDHADHYLGLARSDTWMQKHLQVEGHWPTLEQGVLLMTFHWGAGFWGLRHAAAHGLRPHALVASLESPAYVGRTIMTWYGRSRNAHVARVLGSPNIDVARHLKQVIQTVQNHHSLLGVMDVPADEASGAMVIELLGMRAYVPRALFRLAVDQQLSVIVYVTGLNTQNGKRFLRIKQLSRHDQVEDLAAEVFHELAQTIAEDAAAWHFWGIADRFFRVQRKPIANQKSTKI
jgi:hypothetical protein